MAQPILPINNVTFDFNGTVQQRSEIIKEFIKEHNALINEFDAVRISKRFYSEKAYVFFKVEQNNLFNFLMCFHDYPKHEQYNNYHKLVSELLEILEQVKNKYK